MGVTFPVVRRWRISIGGAGEEADSSCLASLARRNDKDFVSRNRKDASFADASFA